MVKCASGRHLEIKKICHVPGGPILEDFFLEVQFVLVLAAYFSYIDLTIITIFISVKICNYIYEYLKFI